MRAAASAPLLVGLAFGPRNASGRLGAWPLGHRRLGRFGRRPGARRASRRRLAPRRRVLHLDVRVARRVARHGQRPRPREVLALLERRDDRLLFRLAEDLHDRLALLREAATGLREGVGKRERQVGDHGVAVPVELLVRRAVLEEVLARRVEAIDEVADAVHHADAVHSAHLDDPALELREPEVLAGVLRLDFSPLPSSLWCHFLYGVVGPATLAVHVGEAPLVHAVRVERLARQPHLRQRHELLLGVKLF
mmetsp:Transcript_32017/g.98848  ORF Transcript_32017/g.98848 Transcript_32017/m.98848 type:complete len:251 (-) Transcript_32017:358-1110(-)